MSKALAGTPIPNEAAERLAADWFEALTEMGVKVRRGWDRRAPFVEFVEGGHGAYWIPAGSGLDHVYRLVHPDGRVVYVSEPYELYPEDVARFAALEGWRVEIDGRALWFPGKTVRVLFHRQGEVTPLP